MQCETSRWAGRRISAKQKLRRSPTILKLWQILNTGERCSPLQICCHRFRVLAVFIFNFQVTFEVRHWVLCPRLRIHKISNAHPRFDTSTLQPVPESLIVFTKSQGLYVPASIKTLSTYTRKVPFLLHKKCNNCRNVAKLKYKSFVCINLCR